MLTLLKVLFVLAVIALVGLAGFAYLGDLSPTRTEMSTPVTLDAQ